MAPSPAAPASDDERRLDAARRLRLRAGGGEAAIDRLVALAAGLFQAPAVVLSFVDEQGCGRKAESCARGALPAAVEEPLCRAVLRAGEAIAVPDAATDERFRDAGGRASAVRAFLAAPLRTAAGLSVAVLAIIDDRPRVFSEEERALATRLAAIAHDELELRAAALRADENAEDLRRVLDAAPLAVITIDPNGVVTSWNPAAERIFGWSATEVVGRFLPYFPAERRHEYDALMATMIESRRPQVITRQRQRKDGAAIQVHIAATPLFEEDGRLGGALMLMEDVTERHRAEQALRLSERSFRTLIERAPIGIAISREGRFEYVNEALLALLGYERVEELLGRPVLDLVHPDDRALVANHVSQPREAEPTLPRDERLLGRGGREILAEITGIPLVFQGAQVTVAVVRDVTEARRLQESLLLAERAAARVDPLTGLLNRRGFMELVARETARADREGTTLCFALFDIDHFKAVNDRYGHATGDRVLQGVARAAAAALRASDVAIRWGGEEILAMLPATTLEGGQRVAERVRRIVERLEIDNAPSVTISAGVAEWRRGEDVSETIARADRRMYEAKSEGRNLVR